jgi:hypothetical protein
VTITLSNFCVERTPLNSAFTTRCLLCFMSAPKLSAAERLRIAREKNPLPSGFPPTKTASPETAAPLQLGGPAAPLQLGGPAAPLQLAGPAAPLQLAGPAVPLQLAGPAAPLRLAGPANPDPGVEAEPAPVGAVYSQLAAMSVRPSSGAAERLRLAREANPLERMQGEGAAPAYPTSPRPTKGVVRTEAGELVLLPCYEWQELPEGVSVPPGLDIEMPLDGKPRQARIPPRWQLKVSTAEHGFWRHEVTKLTSALELRQGAAMHVGLPLDAVLLSFAGALVEDGATVEELGLFGRERELLVVTQ